MHKELIVIEDMILSVSTLLELLQRRICSGRVRVREVNGEIILTPIDNKGSDGTAKKSERQLGFLSGTLPESFFDPLSEEELKLWGL